MKILVLCRYGFYLSVLLFFYVTLLPFNLEATSHHLGQALSNIKLVPYWDVERGRIHGLTDMMSNVILTVPIGFFGVLWFGRKKGRPGIAKWFFIGLCFGLVSEMIQLAIPARTSDITDVLNNGFGALAGAIAAVLLGRQILDFVSGALMERRRTCFWILAGIIAIGMLLPLDLSLDVGDLKSGIKGLLLNPWERGIPIQDEWIPMVEFAMLGALAAVIARARLIVLAIVFPFVFEMGQLIVASHSLSLRDLTMNLAGVGMGVVLGRYIPSLVRPMTGFMLMSLAVIAQGLSPYHFGGRSHFEWIPLIEYYYRTSGAALYDALSGLLSYGLLAALWPRRTTILWAIVLAAGIEIAQVFLPGRAAGVTDVFIAGMGAWAGYAVVKASEDFGRESQ